MDEDKKEMVDIVKVKEKLARGETVNIAILQKLYLKLFELHKKVQQKISLFSLAGIAGIIAVTVISSLVTSFIFPTIFQGKAATNTWTQTDWNTLSADTAADPGDQSGWAKYSAADANITASSTVQLVSTSASFTHTLDADFSGTNATTTVADNSVRLEPDTNTMNFNQPTIAAGSGHTVGLKTDGTVVGVGYNSNGQINVSAWAGIKAIAAGSEHTVGLKTDGTVVAVGK
ncbi:hypothetical protein HY798_02625, partial [Candidatus Falkowbacteria bacterium]|nr:hypothetical protein [Candidatus Falkowbacteria bacterium]